MRRILVLILFTLLFSVEAKAEVTEFNFDGLDTAIEEKTDLSFNELMEDIVSGKGILNILRDKILHLIKEELFFNNVYIRSIVVIGILSAFMNIAAQDIKDKGVAEIIGLIDQIMIIGVAAASFKNSISLLTSTAEDITEVVESAVPFIIMLLTATGNTAAIGGGGIISIGTALTASLVNNLIAPILVISILLRLLNILSKRQLLDKLSDLFMSAVSLGLKASAYFFVFLITFEKISGGIINKSVGSSFKSLIKMVPVIGDVVGGAGDIALGTISAIKNGAGLVMVVILIIISLLPLMQIGITAFIFKLLAAVLEPVCDKQTIEIIDTIGEGNMMVLSALFIISIMFIMSCAILLLGVS